MSGTSRLIQSEAVAKGGDTFKKYAEGVKNANKKGVSIKEIPCGKKSYGKK